MNSEALFDDSTLKLLQVEELMETKALLLSQKFKGKWDVYGERNTKMFHIM